MIAIVLAMNTAILASVRVMARACVTRERPGKIVAYAKHNDMGQIATCFAMTKHRALVMVLASLMVHAHALMDSPAKIAVSVRLSCLAQNVKNLALGRVLVMIMGFATEMENVCVWQA